MSCQHHLIMVEELGQHLEAHSGLKNVLVLGVGGGALCTYLHQKFSTLLVDGVEIDPEMIELAKRYFGFRPNDKLKAHVADGLEFVKSLSSSGTIFFSNIFIYFIQVEKFKIFALTDERYGCIMLDVDCKDRSLGMSCPPPSFVEMSFISTIKACLNTNGKFLRRQK